MIPQINIGLSAWSSQTTIFYHSECVVLHAILSYDHLQLKNWNHVRHLEFLTNTIGIRQLKCLCQPSNGDMLCVRLTRIIFVCLTCAMCTHVLHEFDLVRGSPTQIMAQIRTSERHHGIDARLLSLKWGIGLEKARDTIKHTTQYNIRSAILPLTRRYRTDLLSQRLKRLST